MLNRKGLLLLSVLAFGFITASACKKEEVKSVVPAQEAWTIYQAENVNAYTLDEEGNLYTFESTYSEDTAELYLIKSDLEGSQIWKRPFEVRFNSYIDTMTVKNGVLYFAPSMYEENRIGAVLYSYNLETEELIKLKAFPYYERVKRILVGENRIYLLGTNGGNGGSRSDSYTYTGEKLMYYVPANDEIFEMEIAEPIDICFDENGYLVLYAHREDGFYFLLYDASRDAIKTIAKTDEYKMCCMALGSEEGEIIYQSSSRGLVLSFFEKLEVESELYPKGYFWDDSLCCVNGRVACISFDRSVVQFYLEDMKQEAPMLRYIATGYEVAEPYGCGYEMQRMKLEEDKFALKVMAMDQDFDLCLVDSADAFSYNLEKNGVFYPLNDVPGIQEYLDACFPYVREVATDSDGNIWMLPIAVNVPGIVVSEELVRDTRAIVKDAMSYEEYFLAHERLSEEERAWTDTPWVAMMNEFFRQYFATHTSVDTSQFRHVMELFAEHLESLDNSGNAEYTKMRYWHVTNGNDYRAYYVTQLGDNACVYEVPKISGETKNVGTCVFLAVNPYSNHLDTTLQYISSLLAYTMRLEEAPLFFQNRTVEDTPYEKSLYALYENGAIGFTLEYSIYEGYGEVFKDITKLEAYIAETERKLKIYLNE